MKKSTAHYRRAIEVSKNEKIKILFTLDKTHNTAPLGYISIHSGIRDPRLFLQELEENGLVISNQLSNWSTTLSPQFELTNKGREFCKKYLEKQLYP